MAKKVVGREMTSRVGLDSAEAVKSLKQLTAEVRANTSGWKAQETALKSAGEYQKAAAARVNGLIKSMEAQKAKIDELKSRQAGLNRDTKNGEEQYLKLTDQINKASRSYDSMGGQLDRAKAKLQYYNSGLADLQKGYKQITAVSESYVKRLEAEGRSAEANKAKLSGLKQAYSNMEAQYKAQTSELERIKNASGATSDAYKRQQVRVNETATAMAKAKTSQKELVKAMEKEPHGFMSGVRSKLDSVDDKAKKTSHLFGTILGAHLVANGITNAIGQITASFDALKDSVVQYDNKQRTMAATWETLTGSAGKGKQMVNIGNDLASAFNQNINVVDELNQSFYHVFDNAPRTKELTKSILTLGDTLNLSDENVTRLGTNFTHMLSSGKMQLGDFNMINDQLPMYAEKMLEFEKKQQHNSKLTMSTLRDQMSAGKISAKDAEEVMNSLGGKYAKASENLMKTIPGMERSIRTQMPALLDAVYKPIANMKSPLMGQFTKWIGDKNTKAEFKNVGNALASQINNITKAFAGKNFNVGDTLDKMLANLAKGINKLGANIVAHKKEIKSFFSSMKTASKTSFNVFVQSLKDIEPILKIIGGFAEKHPKVFAGLASSAYVASKGITALKLAFNGLDLAKGMGGKLSRLVFKPKVDGAEGERELTKFASFVKRSGIGMGRWLKTTASVATTKAKGALSSMWTHTKSVGGKIGKGLKWTAKIAYKGASKAFRVLGAGIKTLGKAFLSLGRLLLANPIGLVVTAVVALGVAFYEAYKHIKPFRDWVNKALKAVANFGKGIAKWGSNVGKSIGKALGNMSKKWNGFKKSFAKAWNKHWSDMGKSLKNSWNGSIKHTRNFFSSVGKKFGSFKKSFRKSWNSHWNAMGKSLRNNWDSSVKHTRDFFSSMGKKWNGWKKSFAHSWNNHWNDMRSNLHNAWNRSYKHTRDFFSSMGSRWVGWKKSFAHSWNNHWNAMRSNLHNYWNKDLSHTRVFGHSMGDWLSTFRNSFKSGWSRLGSGVENIFRGLWNNLRKLARDGMNDVIDLINGGINAVDSVIHAFGGKRKTIGDLGHVHFAEGTGMFSGSRNPITKPTLAMLNDGNDSPQTGNKEMVMLPNGDSGIVQGRNTKMLLPAGSEVLSASETATLMAMQGVTKYAKGTGFFGDILNSVTSGISGVASWVGKKVGSLEKFFKTATNIIAHPIKSLENLFGWSSKGISGVMSNIGHGLFNGVEKQAKTWWSTLWSMVDLNGGGGSYGGGWQSPGSGWTHTDGFGSPRGGGHVHDGNDFSASVGTAFHAMHGGTVIRVGNPPAGWGDVGYNIVTRDSTGKEIIYQEFGNAKDVRVHQGQHVKTGDTLGVLGRSGLGTGPHLHVGLTNGGSVWSRGGYSTSGWLDITKQHGKDKGSDADSDTNNSLQKMIKKQVGGGFWKFISKIASMFGDDGGSGNPGGSGVQRWKSDVESALSKLGLSTSASMVSRVLRQINTESGGNPRAMGGTDGLADGHAMGLMQVKPGTFRAYHLPGHNNIWNGYDNMLAGLNYAKHRYGSGLSFLGNGHGYENGGIINTNQLIEVAEHNKPEMVLPLTNKSRANQLITQANQIINGSNDSQVASIDSESNKKLDKLISLMSAILGNMGNVQAVIAKADVVNAVKSDNKTASQYSQMMGY
ncbi:tape measure protein [Pediococcus acidilactici]|uniref:tape measure protein n=1 Tax=Pediococcus acidilactici TaxID=1254 RepID=UPI0013134B7F|nr:tape measure protein [Pediococcus acidilactici]KAF0341449.1 peptidoglycan DD-metalloendopeptidase family protein [Pediococcus acidilactici]KAF0352978.1 peptidoglycan DD-metalloendopeptidase family protein [Pediococcus acidilactici]KAF0356785.1 peptidoglycan DD-metalloendopeptidase family protein [Pediococcus acidilactici]KAF0376856.1 peptidoglycan DD-metalloendopeptidase family protein [Pediococcus acidilactici]KAF0398860.1 peptidoglycan DD-metalloendopeptidase family protein [Pediococcus a